MENDVLIIGGGLSGLHTLYRLQKLGVSCALVEGRKRLGGRILSVSQDEQNRETREPGFDLGPAWFWPGQSRMTALVQELGLQRQKFTENPKGATVYEDASGRMRREIIGGAMTGSYRLKGGICQIVDELLRELPENRINRSSRVTHLSLREKGVVTKVEGIETSEWTSRFVVMALPPRVAMTRITFSPEFSPTRVNQLNRVATWMAGQAKVVALYDKPFWREQGLSGDVISHRGPLQEIHDASTPEGGPYALFGFVGVPVKNRQGKASELKTAAVDQLVRIFGDQAAAPKEVYFKDWAFDTFTATAQDHQPVLSHPSNDPGELVESHWQNRLLWSGTETAPMNSHHNGYLEGALEASENTLSLLKQLLDRQL